MDDLFQVVDCNCFVVLASLDLEDIKAVLLRSSVSAGTVSSLVTGKQLHSFCKATASSP